MTSKKALRYLLANSEELFTECGDEKFYLDAVEFYNIVLKDLEILEILKKNTIIIKDKEEYNKVKDWLIHNDL